jgi:hypothetical protein
LTETNDSIAAVGELIQERRKYEGWLTALEARHGQTPQHVYDRVKADYEARLHEAIERIGAHSEALSQREEALTARLAEMAEIEQRRIDERAEAELRAHVGEITAEAWDATSGEIDSALAGLAEERSVIERDIADLRGMLAAARPRQPAELGSVAAPDKDTPAEGTEVRARDAGGQAGSGGEQAAGSAIHASVGEATDEDSTGLDRTEASIPREPEDMEIPIEAPRARATPGHGAEALRASGAVDLADLPIDIPAEAGADDRRSAAEHQQLELPTGEHGTHDSRSSASSLQPSAGPDSSRPTGLPARRDSFDELAFLKTVTGMAPPDATRAPAAPQRPEPRSGSAIGASDAFPTAPRAPVRSSTPVERDESESALRGVDPKPSKTLKCSECGSMNSPTEWYCERCGGELAAL